ncbi:hypothetical protein BaLi_c21340 [Bacillus paralicheniformis ATCC 9945a]|nr:hypothetical protein BaLi_c21340 [Bacillus paralicheniformis ATCC 9945a]
MTQEKLDRIFCFLNIKAVNIMITLVPMLIIAEYYLYSYIKMRFHSKYVAKNLILSINICQLSQNNHLFL